MKEFDTIDYVDDENQSLLHIFVDDIHDEVKCLYGISTLLKYGLSQNLKSDYDYNFIQLALYTGYSEDFILKIIKKH